MTTKTKPTKRRTVPKILPREPLTKKALAAISLFASIKAGSRFFHHDMVRFVLRAERMRRKDLYEWLESKGYKWDSRTGVWKSDNVSRAIDPTSHSTL